MPIKPKKLSAEQIKKIVSYWQKTAEHDYDTLKALFAAKKYSDALFFGHIILEKTLKAHFVKNIRREAPRIHDLLELSKRANVKLTEEELTYLKIVNRFNMRARYPDVKLRFYKECTSEYTKENLKKIQKIYKKLCQEFKHKK